MAKRPTCSNLGGFDGFGNARLHGLAGLFAGPRLMVVEVGGSGQ